MASLTVDDVLANDATFDRLKERFAEYQFFEDALNGLTEIFSFCKDRCKLSHEVINKIIEQNNDICFTDYDSKNQSIIPFKIPPKLSNYRSIKPIYYDGYIVIATKLKERKKAYCGIFRYNIALKEWRKIASYPSKIKNNNNNCSFLLNSNGAVIYKDKLYITASYVSSSTHFFMVLNLKSFEWNVIDKTNIDFIANKLISIPSPIDKTKFNLHTFDFCGNHMIFNEEKHEFKIVNKKYVGRITYLFYIKSQKQFGAVFIDTSEEWMNCNIKFCQFLGEDNWKWMEKDDIMNCGEYIMSDKMLFAFDQLLFVFEWSNIYDVGYVLDIKTKNWFKLEVKQSPLTLEMNAVITENNMMHCIGIENKWKCRIHKKVSLYNMIPQTLNDFYNAYYSKLIFGYLRRILIEKQYNMNLTLLLQKLILNYFPCFL